MDNIPLIRRADLATLRQLDQLEASLTPTNFAGSDSEDEDEGEYDENADGDDNEDRVVQQPRFPAHWVSGGMSRPVNTLYEAAGDVSISGVFISSNDEPPVVPSYWSSPDSTSGNSIAPPILPEPLTSPRAITEPEEEDEPSMGGLPVEGMTSSSFYYRATFLFMGFNWDLEQHPTLATSYLEQPLAHMITYIPISRARGHGAILTITIPLTMAGLPPTTRCFVGVKLERANRKYTILVSYVDTSSSNSGCTPQTALGLSTSSISTVGRMRIPTTPCPVGCRCRNAREPGHVHLYKKRIINNLRDRWGYRPVATAYPAATRAGENFSCFVIRRDQGIGLRCVPREDEKLAAGGDVVKRPEEESERYVEMKEMMPSLLVAGGGGVQGCKSWEFWLPEGWVLGRYVWKMGHTGPGGGQELEVCFGEERGVP